MCDACPSQVGNASREYRNVQRQESLNSFTVYTLGFMNYREGHQNGIKKILKSLRYWLCIYYAECFISIEI